MDGTPQSGGPVPNNVFDLAAYRNGRSKVAPVERFTDTGAHVYVDLHQSGLLEYGLAKATSENALYLLEPLLLLSVELIKIHMDGGS